MTDMSINIKISYRWAALIEFDRLILQSEIG